MRPPLNNSHSSKQTLTNQKSRAVSSWLLIGLNLIDVFKKPHSLPGLAPEDQFSLVHASTASSPRSQGVFVEDTNRIIQASLGEVHLRFRP